MKIGIVGAGWYGCHLGSVLLQLGHDVTIYEAAAEVLPRASALNQARLHAGYHYPRCYATRSETAACFKRFMATYPHFTRAIEKNIYAVSQARSVMDFTTYTHIMRALGLNFTEVDAADYGLTRVDGAINTEERSLDFGMARAHFRVKLGSSLKLDRPVSKVRENGAQAIIDGETFDLAINCTWCALDTGMPVEDIFYEPTTLFYYEATEPFYGALTTMDGDCFSVYPYQDNVFTLSHVAHTPRGQFSNYAAADHVNNSLTSAGLDTIRNRMVAEVVREFPSFPERFRYAGVQKSIKTKYVNARASRETIVARHGRIITVLSGKIDTIFIAEDAVRDMVQTLSADTKAGEKNERLDYLSLQQKEAV